MKLIFEFARIAAFCFAGEVCHLVLPLPIPASVYGLMLLLAALRFGVVKLEQVRTAALFLTGIFPLLFVPAAAGVMDLWADLQAMLVPVLLALIPITILVMTVSGCVTQRLAERKEKSNDHTSSGIFRRMGRAAHAGCVRPGGAHQQAHRQGNFQPAAVGHGVCHRGAQRVENPL